MKAKGAGKNNGKTSKSSYSWTGQSSLGLYSRLGADTFAVAGTTAYLHVPSGP